MGNASAVLIVAIVVLNLPCCYVWYRVLYKDLDEFGESIYFWLRPDIFSAFSGEYWDDQMASFKFFIWLALSFFSGWMGYQYVGVPYLLPLFS